MMTPRLRAESTTVSHVGRQQLHVSDRDLVQLLASAQPHDLRLGWVQTQSAGLHPVVDVGNARCEADNGGGGFFWLAY